ncbi:hypothetical protein DOY81_003251 [Sarcophaga bullata]|nr:hypothetical protein DOY81_003251 [Sarcophaga bullata]
MAKTCFDRYNRIMKITRLMSAICGADIMNPKYKMSPLTWLVIVAINAFYCCTIYTMYVGLVIEGDWKLLLQSLSLVGSAVQGYSKLISSIYRRLIMIQMDAYLTKVYKEHQELDYAYRQVLQYRIDLTSKILKMVLWMYIIGGSIILLFPFIYGALYGQKLFVMQFLLPGIDPNTDTGYILHNGFHIFLICLGAFGNFAGDMFIFIFIINIPLLKDLLKIKCEKLSHVALATHDFRKSMPMLKEIIKWHQNYCNWPAAFAYLVYSCVMLYAYCGLGHLVEISNDEVVNVIYGDCLWYELSVPEQKLVLLMMRKSQNPINLTVGQIMPLSMSTALQLTKAIYSYMMMLVNFLANDDEL